jgi:APA family basic amino acid/polyamine antiporter
LLALPLSGPCSPAVILSYAVAGLSALLSSLCYAEFAAAIPLSGGAYSYVAAVFGEYMAW